MKRMKLSDIKIKKSFANSIPSEEKMAECRKFWDMCNKQDRYVVVNHNKELIDGYVQYLVLKENGIEDAEVKIWHCKRKRWSRKTVKDIIEPYYRTKEITYIYGIHPNTNKEYVWRVPKSWSVNGLEDGLKIGDKIFVNTKFGIKKITITRIERLSICPVDIPVKKVAKRIINLDKKDTDIIASLNKISKSAFKIENGFEEKECSDIKLCDECSEIHNTVTEIWNTVMKH